jgi:hypothetical protein
MADNGSSPAVGRPALFFLWGGLCTRVAKNQNTTGFVGDLRSQQQELTAYVGFGESACIQEDQS